METKQVNTVAQAWPMPFVAGNKTPRDSGYQKFEKDGVAASGIR